MSVTRLPLTPEAADRLRERELDELTEKGADFDEIFARVRAREEFNQTENQ